MRCLAYCVSALIAFGGAGVTADDPLPIEWTTIANNDDPMPGCGRPFTGYRQPSLNEDGFVTFRALGEGRVRTIYGVFTCETDATGEARLHCAADTMVLVPWPNNTYARFNAFPAFARIDIDSNAVVTRGESSPVWTLPPSDTMETYAGTAGIFVAMPASSTESGWFMTGVNQLGNVRDAKTGALLFPQFQVPGTVEGMSFDAFPCAPAVSDRRLIVFKGTYRPPGAPADQPIQSGIFFRNVKARGGMAPVQLLANSDTPIPGADVKGLAFGYFAPPSAARRTAVFVGMDDELSPRFGGIYHVSLTRRPELRSLVAIGDPVPGIYDATAEKGFRQIGDALSWDGRYVGFWASWGTETRPRMLYFPDDRECYEQPNVVRVPVHQGIFVHDTRTGTTHPIAMTGGRFFDFLDWTFVSDEDEAHAGWRRAAFVSVHGTPDDAFRVAFKGMLAPDAMGDRFETKQGIFLSGGPDIRVPITAVRTGMCGSLLDPEAPRGVAVTSVGMERDGFRGGRLAISTRMYDEVTDETWAGLYMADTTNVGWCAGDVVGDNIIDAADLEALLERWGKSGPSGIADLDGDGDVDFADLLALLRDWGSCPQFVP